MIFTCQEQNDLCEQSVISPVPKEDTLWNHRKEIRRIGGKTCNISLFYWEFGLSPPISVQLYSWNNSTKSNLVGTRLGFYFSQQASIWIFVELIFVYAWLMNRLERKYTQQENEEGAEQP